MAYQEPITGTRLRTPRAPAVAGILFSLLLGLALILITVSAPSGPATAGAWRYPPQGHTQVRISQQVDR
jgi:hypothetical protein